METDYQEGDIVIFEQTNDYARANGKDAAISINCTECTFKTFFINDNGVVLQSYNNAYMPMVFTKEQVNELPITVLGIAVEIRRKRS